MTDEVNMHISLVQTAHGCLSNKSIGCFLIIVFWIKMGLPLHPDMLSIYIYLSSNSAFSLNQTSYQMCVTQIKAEWNKALETFKCHLSITTKKIFWQPLWIKNGGSTTLSRFNNAQYYQQILYGQTSPVHIHDMAVSRLMWH